MENITKQFTEFMIEPREEYPDELNQYINLHNVSVSELAQSTMEMSSISLLIKKGIITAEELVNEMQTSMNSLQSFETLKSNYNALLEYIREMTENE